MLLQIEEYYREKGILSTAFSCAYKENCKEGCAKFTGPKSAFISTGYEKNKLPRLLFLSLDSGSGDENNKNRLPIAVRNQEEFESDVLSLDKRFHWYRTHELAWYIFKKFDSNIKIEDTNKFFAHANSAKCCMNNTQRGKANSVMFQNCETHLHGELSILSPEIIVSQGNEAKNAMHSIYDKVITDIDDYSKIIQLNGSEVFWLHTYHPRYFGGFYKQRDNTSGWEKYSQLIHKFINKT